MRKYKIFPLSILPLFRKYNRIRRYNDNEIVIVDAVCPVCHNLFPVANRKVDILDSTLMELTCQHGHVTTYDNMSPMAKLIRGCW